MKQGKREPKRHSDKERERQSEREDYIQVQIVLCKRGVWPARQLDSVILCEARFKNFNSPTACPAKRSDYATRIRKQSSLLLCQAAEAFASTFSLLQAKSFNTCGCLPSCHGSSKLILFFTCFPAVFSTDFHVSLFIFLLQPQNVCPIRSILPATAAGHIDPGPGKLS